MPSVCPSCHLSLAVFRVTGRFGCATCYTTFGLPASSFYKDQLPIFSWQNFTHPRLESEQVKTTFLRAFSSKISYIRQHLAKLSHRYRILRNLRNTHYKREADLTKQLISFLQGHLPSYEQENDTTKSFTWQNIRFYLWEEDQLRCEWYGKIRLAALQKLAFLYQKELFDHNPEHGFLAACPTNTGRADKFSIAMDLQNLYHLDGGLFLSQLYKDPYWGWRSPGNSPFISTKHTTLIFFVKNATAIRKAHFLRYIFFLFCLNNAISG
ncbi:MAG: hypothetical protein AAF518_21160 [Spirochaetota bacterium]